MQLFDRENIEHYLRETARLEPLDRVRVRELEGGVSNVVLLVERLDRPGEDFVVKQARARLRTRQPWLANVERAWREAEVLTECERLLARRSTTTELSAYTPRILFEDRENYLFAMTAAPRPNAVWKEALLAGRAETAIAQSCAVLLATLHGESWLDPQVERRLGDRTLFDELRIDPCYRTLAAVHPEIAPALERLIASLELHARSLVHADFSPKNLLVFCGGLMMVDFETGHYGDPAFDLGFFLSHLVLKACHHLPRHGEFLDLTRAFHQTYSDLMRKQITEMELDELWTRGVRNFAACAWARLDGKSPVEYLSDNRRDEMRGLCRRLFDEQPNDWPAALAVCASTFDAAK